MDEQTFAIVMANRLARRLNTFVPSGQMDNFRYGVNDYDKHYNELCDICMKRKGSHVSPLLACKGLDIERAITEFLQYRPVAQSG